MKAQIPAKAGKHLSLFDLFQPLEQNDTLPTFVAS